MTIRDCPTCGGDTLCVLCSGTTVLPSGLGCTGCTGGACTTCSGNGWVDR